MTQKKTLKNYQDLAKSRNHEVISMSDTKTPSNGDITILCKTCNNQFTTSAKSYTNAQKTGCPACKKVISSNTWRGRARTNTPEQAQRNLKIKQHIEETRKEKGKEFEAIKNQEDLKAKLLNELYLPNGEKNAYNAFILDRFDNPVIGELMEEHHILPKHAGGPDVEWNLISLTPEDHVEAHALRASVYNEAGDKNVIKFRSKTSNITEQLLKAKALGDQTRREQGTGIYAPGMSAKGGSVGGSVKSEKKDLKQSTKMTTPVYNALYNGSRWKHEKTGTEVIIEPNTVFTLPNLVKKLLEALPPCDDKTTLTNAKISTATSNLARVIKQERLTSYGWSIYME